MKTPLHITRGYTARAKALAQICSFGRKLRIARRHYVQLGDLGGLKYEKTNN